MLARSLVFASLALACASASGPAEPSRAAPAVAPATVASVRPPAAQAPAVEEYRPEVEWVGVPACDAYIELYRKCEPELAAEIAAGDRRSARSEAAWLRYMHEHEKDPGLADACVSMLTALRGRCSP